MRIEYNRSVQKDVDDILTYFDGISSIVGDRVFKEFTNLIAKIAEHPTSYPTFKVIFRKAPFRHYPFDIVYKLSDDKVRILVVKHKKRNDNYGMKRK
jgi:plasmid stabilization system protein ParE